MRKQKQEFTKKIIPNNPLDPLLLQILPQAKEQQKRAGFLQDPLGEKTAQPIPGLLHKYFGRVLLLVTNTCPIYCRFCFRRYLNDMITDWQSVLNYIAKNPEIKEVILSGGDPLMLKSQELATIINKLAKIKHVQILRVHTRVPIAAPKLITQQLITALTSTRLPVVMVVHSNHPQELDTKVAAAVKKLKRANILVLNQSVLLKKINDDTKTLIALSEKLFATGILPYYLHLLDKVQGTAHFYVGSTQARKLHKIMTEKLPGFLVPKLVYEKRGAKSKVLV
ncbi:MAG: KamA family radical SAM protein [Gammaproteobacteria bacterium]|nr:KamA family radical SAM protein [Gammaproteobacteria bacterium]